VVNIIVSAEWIVVREVLLKASWPYVEARVAVAAALVELETADETHLGVREGGKRGYAARLA
jgi:hypothetical protein